MAAPQCCLKLMGWQRIDPAATRLVDASLLDFGGISFIARKPGHMAFRHMLTMKLLWSIAVVLGLSLPCKFRCNRSKP